MLLMVAVATWQLRSLDDRWITSYRVRGVLGAYREPVLGYTPAESYRLGEAIPFHIHTTAPATARVYRLAAEELEDQGVEYAVDTATQSSKYHTINGFDWPSNLAVSTQGWKSGYYILRVTQDESGSEFNVPFILKPQRPNGVSIVASTNTWNAYNTCGGRSNYHEHRYLPARALAKLIFMLPVSSATQNMLYEKLNTSLLSFTGRSSFLPRSRPDIGISKEMEGDQKPFDSHCSQVLRAEWCLAAFLEKNNIDYSVYSDVDLALDEEIQQSKLLIFNVHSEYWSPEMIARLSQYMNGGGKVVFASGNNMYRGVQDYGAGIRVVNQLLDAKTVRSLIGTFYQAVTFSTPGAVPCGNVQGAAYARVARDHWIFNGVRATGLALFGKQNLNRLATRLGAVGASGFETDQIGPGSEEFKVLAIARNPVNPAYLVYKKMPLGGWIVNTSSVTWNASLTVDPVVDAITMNLVNAALNGPARTEENDDNSAD